MKLASTPEVQTSSLVIAGKEVPLDIRMHGDTGLMFGASFFKIPETLIHLEERERADTLWNYFSQRSLSEPLAKPGPIDDGLGNARGGWFSNENGSTAMVVLVNGDRAVAAFAGILAGMEGPATERKVARYFDSLRPVNGR